MSLCGRYDREQEIALLAEYGRTDADAIRHLHAMRWIVRIIEMVWAHIQSALRPGDAFNFAQYAASLLPILDAGWDMV